jgi:sulfate transport system permease protein
LGHIRGLTETLPLYAEAMYNEWHFVGAFARASLLADLAIVTLVARNILERAGQMALRKGSAA